jgi:gluconokinase
LKRSYRDIIIDGRRDVRLVYLKGDLELIAHRFIARGGHFMPVSLLRSQFDTLEEPGADENALVVSIDIPPRAIVDQIIAAFRL